MSTPTFSTEVSGAGNYPAIRFNQRERKILESINTHLASGTDTFANKTLTSPVLTTPQINDTSADHQYVFAVSELAADRTVTLPLLTGNDEFLFADHAKLVKNKILDSSNTVVDATDNTIKAIFDLSGATADKDTTLTFAQTDDRVITFPDATDTLVGKATTDVLTNKTLTDPVIGAVAHKEVTGTISSAEILALNATPKELIAAPGASKALIIDEIQLFLDYGSADYVAGAGEDLTFQYATSDTVVAAIDNDAVTFLTASADAHWIGRPQSLYDVQAAGSGDGVLLSGFDNEALEVTIATGEVITGDSDIKYRIKYHEVDYLT